MNYKTPYDRNNYYFHRTDPKPWVPFDEDEGRGLEWAAWAGIVILAASTAAFWFWV